MSVPVRTVLLLVILLSSASSFSLRLCPYCRAEVEGRAEPSRAVVELLPASGDLNITGSLVLEQGPFGVFFRGEIEGLSPGKHGFHVHQTGDTGNNCKAAGGHFNPEQQQHSSPSSPSRHAGDLGNILTLDGFPLTLVYLLDRGVTLGDGGERDIAGRAIVVHAGEDDLGQGQGDLAEESRRTGNAGARVACGVITLLP